MTESGRHRRFLAFAILLASAAAQLSPQANPFLSRPEDPAVSGDARVVSAVPGSGGFIETRAYRALVLMQRRIQESLSNVISTQRESPTASGLALLIGLSFGYGFVHALGPGHRKIVLTSYFMNEGGSVAAGTAAAYGIGLVHAGSAVLLIFGLFALISGPIMNTFTSVSLEIERISYWFLLLIGVLLLIIRLVQRCSDWPVDENRAASARFRDRRRGAVRSGGRLLFVLATGAVPCPVTAAVLVFAIGNGAPGLGVIAAASVSLGIGTFLAVLVAVIVLVKRAVGTHGKGRLPLLTGRVGSIVEAVFEISGAVVMIGFAALMLLPR